MIARVQNRGGWPPGRKGRLITRAATRSRRIRTARIASMVIIVRRLSHRSTKTPEMGPTTINGTRAAMSTPLTASGAQDSPRAMEVATQSTSVVSKTRSPISEMPWPVQSSAKLRLMNQRGTGSVLTPSLAGTGRSPLQPLGLDLPGRVNVDHPQLTGPGVHELVRRARRDDHNVPAGHVERLVAGREASPALLDHEDLGIGVLVQSRSIPGRRIDHDTRGAGILVQISLERPFT